MYGKIWFFNFFCGMPSEMANNDRKQIPLFVAPRCGAICYVIYFLIIEKKIIFKINKYDISWKLKG